jgi:hypothetical protein
VAAGLSCASRPTIKVRSTQDRIMARIEPHIVTPSRILPLKFSGPFYDWAVSRSRPDYIKALLCADLSGSEYASTTVRRLQPRRRDGVQFPTARRFQDQLLGVFVRRSRYSFPSKASVSHS